MNSEIEQDIWEILIKAAVIENCLDETLDYPSDEELNKLVVSAGYDAKMRRFIRHYKYRETARYVLKTSRKIASVILVIFGISFAVLMSFKEVRAECQTVIIEVYKKYIEFHFVSNNDTNEALIEFGYVPEGFTLIQNDHDEWGDTIQYKNSSGDKIELNFFAQKYTLQIDNEHYHVSNVQVNDLSGKFFAAQQKQLDNYLVWDTLDGYYVLSSSLDENELIKIAINLK